MWFDQRDEIGFIVLIMLVVILVALLRSFVKRKRAQLKLLGIQPKMLERDFYMYILSFVFYMMAFCGVLLVIRLIMFAYCLWETKGGYIYLSTVFLILLGLGVIIRKTCKEKQNIRARRRSQNMEHSTRSVNYCKTLTMEEFLILPCTLLLVLVLSLLLRTWKMRKKNQTSIRKTMISEAVVVGAIVSVILCALLSTCIIFFSIKKDSRLRRRTNQRQHRVVRAQLIAQPDQNSVYSISGRLQNHQHSDPYLSIDHIAITNELNKPPKYDDAPPSYDEALKLALSNSLQTNEVVAALPNRTN